MCRENDLTVLSSLFPPLDDFRGGLRGQLVVEIVQVADIRLEVIQHQPQLLPGLAAVNGLDRVSQLRQLAAAVEIHIGRISIDPVANTAAFMVHTEELDLVTVLFQCLTQFKYVRL